MGDRGLSALARHAYCKTWIYNSNSGSILYTTYTYYYILHTIYYIYILHILHIARHGSIIVIDYNCYNSIVHDNWLDATYDALCFGVTAHNVDCSVGP